MIDSYSQNAIPVEILSPMKVRIGDWLYGVVDKNDKGKQKPWGYPAKGMQIPQLAESNLKIAFQRNLKTVEIEKGEMGLIPQVWGCEAVILVYYTANGKRHVSIVHNTAGILLEDDSLYKAMLERVGGKGLRELRQIVNEDLQFGLREDAVTRLFGGFRNPIFSQVLIVSPNPGPISNVLKHYTDSLKINETKVADALNNPKGAFNILLYNNGRGLQYIVQFKNEETYHEFEFNEREG